jgi:hypothetical protein
VVEAAYARFHYNISSTKYTQPLVISILKELDVYKGDKDEEKELTLINHRIVTYSNKKIKRCKGIRQHNKT